MYLVDLLGDVNPAVRAMASRGLDVVMDCDQAWAERIRRFKFEAHNQEWLALMQQQQQQLLHLQQAAGQHHTVLEAQNLQDQQWQQHQQQWQQQRPLYEAMRRPGLTGAAEGPPGGQDTVCGLGGSGGMGSPGIAAMAPGVTAMYAGGQQLMVPLNGAVWDQSLWGADGGGTAEGDGFEEGEGDGYGGYATGWAETYPHYEGDGSSGQEWGEG